MKRIPVLASWATIGILSVSAQAFADHANTIVFDGSDSATTVQLEGEESHTRYETREVPATCYRDVFAGYRQRCYDEWRNRCYPETVCRPYGLQDAELADANGHERRPPPGDRGPGDRDHAVPRPGPGPGGGRDHDRDHDHDHGRPGGGYGGGGGGGSRCHVVTRCHQEAYPVCHSEPYYQSVPYACTRQETVPVGQELDYRVNADVQVKFTLASAEVRPAEGLRVSLDGESVSLSTTSLSGQVLLYAKSTQSVEVVRPDEGRFSPGEKRVHALFEITAVDASRALSGVNAGIGDLALRGSELSFTLGTLDRVEARNALEFGLKLQRKRWFGAKHVFEGSVLPGAVNFEEQGGRTLVRLALDRLNLNEEIKANKNYRLDLSVGLRKDSAAGRLLNPETLGRPVMVQDREVHSQ